MGSCLKSGTCDLEYAKHRPALLDGPERVVNSGNSQRRLRGLECGYGLDYHLPRSVGILGNEVEERSVPSAPVSLGIV